MNSLFANWNTTKNRLYRNLAALTIIVIIEGNMNIIHVDPYSNYSRVFFFLLLCVLYYTNMYILIPNLFFKARYISYGLSFFGLIFLSFITIYSLSRWLTPQVEPYEAYCINAYAIGLFILMVSLLLAATTVVKLFQRWIVDSKRVHELETSTIQAELEQLKNQINPHFLFNMLNNTQVLIQKDAEKAAEVLLNLSDFLRYQIYDSSRPKVFLSSDIHFLQDFLSLEKIRRDDFDVQINQQGEIDGLMVAPLLFITFVENAVKYSLDTEAKSFIHLDFIRSGNTLIFKCRNSKPDIVLVKTENSGLGLKNIKRRLELLYPENHDLVIEDKKNLHSVFLTINL
jgi:sensor histidine kinase YesM